MLAGLRKLGGEWRGLRSFQAVPRDRRRVVFYAEDRGYWTYFEPVYRALREGHGEEVLYVTSSERDPVLRDPPEGIHPFCVGEGSMRTLFFATLDADVLLMTMPDLHCFHIRRSPHPVKYVYLHHSIVSTHMVYRPAAFDHFDAILCVGPHHVEETRARERALGLPGKTLVEHGYGRLDAILAAGGRGPLARPAGAPPQVLVAPTWGDLALLERHGAQVVQAIVDSGFRVVVRPHPRTRKLRPDVLDDIERRFGENPLFAMDEDADAHASLRSSDVMVSDWSGAALEFALGLERPVLFVDVPRKVLNREYEALGIEPLEARIREQVGMVVAPGRLGDVGAAVRAVVCEAERWQAATSEARARWIFNPGCSGKAAADYLVSLL